MATKKTKKAAVKEIKKEVLPFSIDNLKKYIKGNVPPHFVDKPGTEAYTYYAQLSEELKVGTIADLGTFQGLSALALAYNPDVKVYSYDITLSNNLVQEKSNIEFIEGDVFNNLEQILQCDIILVDLDPHDGIQEKRFLDILIENNYKGITIWDDTNHNSKMQNFWNAVKLEKEDVSSIAHHSGTGKIIFK